MPYQLGDIPLGGDGWTRTINNQCRSDPTSAHTGQDSNLHLTVLETAALPIKLPVYMGLPDVLVEIDLFYRKITNLIRPRSTPVSFTI